jgi:hypothetical protein
MDKRVTEDIDGHGDLIGRVFPFHGTPDQFLYRTVDAVTGDKTFGA